MTDIFAKAMSLALLERGLFSDKMRKQHPELRTVSNPSLQWLRLTMIEMYRAGWDDAAMNRTTKFPIKTLTDWELTWLSIEKHVDLTPQPPKRSFIKSIQFT